MTTPSIEYVALSPILIVFGAAVAAVVVEAVAPKRIRYDIQRWLSTVAVAGAFAAVLIAAGAEHGVAAMGSMAVDGPALFIQGTVLLLGSGCLALVSGKHLDGFCPQASTVPGSSAEAAAAGARQSEVFPLTLFALTGLLVFPAANDLLTMIVALEVFSLPLYVLCGLARHRRLLSQEAALKYFLLGAFSSAFFIFGVALLYGDAGSFALSEIGRPGTPIGVAGIALVSVGLLFKVGAVPFHSWVPDVYQGAPTAITAFMASATKVAAFGAVLRLFHFALPAFDAGWRPMLGAVAALTMIVASVLTVTQTDVKRLLAYSSVANAGFLLTGVTEGGPRGVAATLFYLVAYGCATLGAFGVLATVRTRDGREMTDLSGWSGLGRRAPVAGVTLTLFLLATAGIPLTSGFVSKFAIFEAAMSGGAAALVLVGVACSAVAAFAYARVILVMFSGEPGPDTAHVAPPGPGSTITIAAGAALTVALGVAPEPLLDLAIRASQFAG